MTEPPRKRAPRKAAPKKANPSRNVNEAKILIEERRRHALELRRQGCTYQQIGDVLGYDKGNAYRDVHTALAAITAEPAADVLQLEIERLDHMLVALAPTLDLGDPKAINAALRVSERRAKLLGLDAPTKTELTGADGGPIVIDQAQARADAIEAIRALRDTRPAAES